MTLPAGWICPLYLAFVLKHLLGDYFLQSEWMAIGKASQHNWLKPLAAHAGVHAIGTLIVALVFLPMLWWLCVVDFFVHGVIDRSKALATRRLAVTEKEPAHWWIFGLDQALHQATHFCFIVAMALAL